jgi:hypothetical protein
MLQNLKNHTMLKHTHTHTQTKIKKKVTVKRYCSKKSKYG